MKPFNYEQLISLCNFLLNLRLTKNHPSNLSYYSYPPTNIKIVVTYGWLLNFIQKLFPLKLKQMTETYWKAEYKSYIFRVLDMTLNYLIVMLYCHLQHHNDTIIKTQWQRQTHAKRHRKTSWTIFTSHFIARVQKGCVGFYCERELVTEHKL